MSTRSDLDRTKVAQLSEKRPLNSPPILNDCLALFKPRDNNQVGQRYNSVFDKELLVVVLGCSYHFHLQLLCLLLCRFLLFYLCQSCQSLCLPLLFYLLSLFFFFPGFFRKFSSDFRLFFLLVALPQQFTFFLALLGALLHHEHLPRLLSHLYHLLLAFGWSVRSARADFWLGCLLVIEI